MLGWQRFGATPMLLFSGIFYPVQELPAAYGCSSCSRRCGTAPSWPGRHDRVGSVAAVVAHTAYLLLFVAVGTAFAMRSLGDRLVEP